MGVFEHFPYVNYHELNLSWILRKIKELEDVIGTQIVDIVARAGVAENAQAIADLTETVETVETTATNAGSAASAAQTTANAAQSTANSAASAASAAQTNINTLSADVANCLTAHEGSAVSGTNTITGLTPGDMIFFVRNATAFFIVSYLDSVQSVVSPVNIDTITMSGGTLTVNRNTPYSGEIIVITKDRNVKINPSNNRTSAVLPLFFNEVKNSAESKETTELKDSAK